MSNPREHKEFAPTAISVGGGGSPDQASPHTPGDIPDMATHRLKTWPQFYEAVVSGWKLFEIRKNDRDFKLLDFLLLEEWEPETRMYTGRAALAQITYITDFAQKPGFVVLGIRVSGAKNTPGDNARNLGTPTSAAFAERDGEDSLPDIVEPIYDSEEQERRVKMAVILAELDRLHAAATAGEWAAEGLPGSLSIRDRAAKLEGK